MNSQILVGICSHKNAEERQNAVRESWLRHDASGVQCRFFVGGESTHEYEEGDTVYLRANDTYEYLPEKVLSFFRYAVHHFDFDWLFKCDDDTYVALERLGDLINCEYDLIGDMLIKERGAPSGGSGYFLSRGMVEKIINLPNLPSRGAEDLIIGQLALSLGARTVATDRLGMYPTPYPMPYNNLVTSHWCIPDYLRAISVFNQESPVCCYSGDNGSWSDTVLFYQNGFFRRMGTGCAGKLMMSIHSLTLHWFSWGDEQLIPLHDYYQGSRLQLKVQQGAPPLSDLFVVPEDTPLYVQLGCGSNILPGWVNLDMPYFDITHTLPWKDESVDALFLEHVIEHVSPERAYCFFEDAMRVLKPGGVLRLAFPDVVRIAREATPEYILFLQQAGWGDGSIGSALRSIICNHGHQAVWSLETIVPVLESVGFLVECCVPGASSYFHLQGLESHGQQLGDVFNQIETSCVESKKLDFF